MIFGFYRVVKDFTLTTSEVTIYFHTNSKWRLIGDDGEKVKITRENVYVRISRELFEKHFKKLAKQKIKGELE